MPRIILGDSKKKLKTIADNTVDLLCTDHPYRYGFMGKDWDKKQDFTDIWKECLRVMKPGAFGFIMNAPRQDCQLLLLSELVAAGFNIQFSSINWCYKSGFPKAGDTGKLIDKRFGLEREVIGIYEHPGRKNRTYQTTSNVFSGDRKNDKIDRPKWEEHKNTETTRQNPYQSGKNLMGKKKDVIKGLYMTKPASPEAAQLEGSKVGHQMKPAYELIVVVMKPLDQSTFIDQALANGKGVTWITDCLIPYTELEGIPSSTGKNCTPGDSQIYNWNNPEYRKKARELLQSDPKYKAAMNELIEFKKKKMGGRGKQDKRWSYGDEKVDGYKPQGIDMMDMNFKGRYPANILVSDEAFGKELSKFFSLDAWWRMKMNIKALPKEQQKTFPFLFVTKASKSEKNKGLENFPTKTVENIRSNAGPALVGENKDKITQTKNTHPTVKPEMLMTFLIILGSREGDVVLDPFAGSGTTAIACYKNNRDCIIIEKDENYYAILKARLKEARKQKKLM